MVPTYSIKKKILGSYRQYYIYILSMIISPSQINPSEKTY